jgi:hypothetical protein
MLFLFFLLLSCEVLLSQEQEHPNYFPLAVGNRWEYIKLWTSEGVKRLVIAINRDTVINGKQYYIFEYNLPYENFNFHYYSMTKYFFTPLDPVRMDESGDMYGYDTLTQNEYLYLPFSKDTLYKPYKIIYDDFLVSAGYNWHGMWWQMFGSNTEVSIRVGVFIFKNNVGMIKVDDVNSMDDCWQIYPWDPPCPPFMGQLYILVYAIIDGEKVYSIEGTDEYNRYIATYDVNMVTTHPEEIKLHQNYPNPFNPSTVIKYQLSDASQVSLRVYDVMGREVTTLVNSFQNEGNYDVTFNANCLASGIYFYKLNTNGKQLINKMLLMK